MLSLSVGPWGACWLVCDWQELLYIDAAPEYLQVISQCSAEAALWQLAYLYL